MRASKINKWNNLLYTLNKKFEDFLKKEKLQEKVLSEFSTLLPDGRTKIYTFSNFLYNHSYKGNFGFYLLLDSECPTRYEVNYLSDYVRNIRFSLDDIFVNYNYQYSSGGVLDDCVFETFLRLDKIRIYEMVHTN